MSYDATETSRRTASPVELYEFSHGTDRFRYTSSDEQQEDGTETFEPEVISRNEINQSQEDSAGNIKVSVPRDNAVAALFIPYMPSTPVGLTIRRKHRLDGSAEFVTTFVGKVASSRYNSAESQWILTCSPITEVFRRTIPIYLYQPQCNNALYSDACGVNKADFKVTAALTSIDGDEISSDAFESTDFGDGYFNNGFVQHGNDVRWVIDHVGDTLRLDSPFTNVEISAGVMVDVYPGCNRDEATCDTKFDNLDRHLGFSRIPTKNPFDSSVEF